MRLGAVWTTGTIKNSEILDLMFTDSLDIPFLQRWVGRTEICHDTTHASAAVALAATLDHKHQLQAGTELPPLWHWIYFWSAAVQSEIGGDGHPQRGDFLPPVPLPRRMWAGGRLNFSHALPIGASATRTSRIVSVTGKRGQSGHLAFVVVKHEIVYNDVLAITEEQDIVYRAAPQPGAVAPAPKLAPAVSMWSRTVYPDPVLLFRYSALTFNGHRIHYDRNYATGVEAYPGLIVHGPLIATLLVDLLLQHIPAARLAEFSFRAIGPLFDNEPFEICAQPSDERKKVLLWAKNPRGELAMQAEATLIAPSTYE